MRNLRHSPSTVEISQGPTTQIKASTIASFSGHPGSLSTFTSSKLVWWELPPAAPANLSGQIAPHKPLPSLEALKGVKLILTLTRRGRQATGELALSLVGLEVGPSSPLTLFTGSWIAHLLGYPRKYRGVKLIEAFMGSALRSYLMLYNFVPFCLCLKGAFFNFNFFWKTVNNPSGQIFAHPITMEVLWDIRVPADISHSLDRLKEFMAASAEEFGRGGLPSLDDEILDYEAKTLKGLLPHRVRCALTWGQVFFLPTRLNKPRRPKKARSIRKRLSKRLVRASGRRFWAG